MRSLFNRKTFTICFVLLAGISAGVLVGAFFAFTHDLPQIRNLETFRPQAVTRIYSSDKVLLAELFQEKRDPVPLESMPRYLTEALVATEDRKFYRHSGVDLKGIARAIIKDIRAGGFVEGASTITQQLAKTLFLTPRKTIVRKIKEAILAFQLERRYTKDEILELYLNQVYFGSGAYGVQSASEIFFGKSVQDLSLAECALIAGMPKSPSRFSPLVNIDLARQRRDTVLKQMLTTGIISAAEYQSAIEEEIELKDRDKKLNRAPYFVDYVQKNLEEILGEAKLYKGGLSIYTTLDLKLQEAAQRAVDDGLIDLEKRMDKNNIQPVDPQAALICLEIKSGGILAMVGGKDFYESPFNRAAAAKRQPGSAFKPIVYAYAIEHGFAQNNLILDAPVVFKGADKDQDWRPENFSETYLGEITLRKALAISQNIPAVRLIEMLGPLSVAQFAHRLGIESNLAPDLSLALGTSEVSLINLTAAYAVFPREGKWIEPYGAMEAADHRGRIVWRAKPPKRLVMTREGAAIITNMLEGVVEEGTGRQARSLEGTVAGKTGTTNNYNDALFIGFSPTVVTGVWVGRDSGGTLGDKETGARAALPIWIQFMQTALAAGSPQQFDLPNNVSRVPIDPQTGLLAPPGSKEAVWALFKKGTEPK
ncbi:MAG: PBP1A family penicillin-binding protein [Desulfobacterales bacterium]|nr:MAG: PBP1A family penicillin-binding protein [Desulfobacterales bacterium]